jgi:hypothetical protein
MSRAILILLAITAMLWFAGCADDPASSPAAPDKVSTGDILDPLELIDTRILDGEADPEFSDDPQVYPYYIVRHGPEAGIYPFTSGDTVPDGAYIVLKALTWSEEPAPQAFHVQGVFQADAWILGGVHYQFQSTYSRADLKPGWYAPYRSLAADTLGFEAGPFHYEVSMRGLLDQGPGDGIRDQTPDVLEFDANFPPCIQAIEMVNLSHDPAAIPATADCTGQDDLAEEALLEIYSDLDDGYDPDNDPGQFSYDTWISEPTLWVDPAGRRIRYDEPPQPGWVEILALPYRMVLYLHGRDHLQEFPPAQRMVERIKAWSYQIDHEADPENLLREGPGQDDIDLRFSLDPDEDISVPPFGEGFLTEEGVWGLAFEVKVPTILMMIGEEGYWHYLLSLNDAPERPTDPDDWPAWQQDPAVRDARTCWDLTTLVFGAGAVQAVAWDQAACDQQPRSSMYHYYDGTRIPTPNGRICEEGFYDSEEIRELNGIALDNFAAPSNDGLPLVKPFRIVLHRPDGSTIEEQTPPPGWVDARALDETSFRTHR